MAVLDLDHGVVAVGRTDSAGDFMLVDLPLGVYRVEVGALGYQTAILSSLAIADSQRVSLRFELPPSPIDIRGVEAVAEAPRRGVQRRSAVAVHRLERERLRDLMPAPLSVILGHLGAPGLRVFEYQRDPGSSTFNLCIEGSRARSPSNRGCRWVAVYVNGHRVADPAEGLRFFGTEDLHSVEYIPPSVAGARWGIGSQNGVLLLTTINR